MTILDYTRDYVLEDDFVRIRPLLTTDYDHLLEYSVGEPEIWSFNAGGAAGAENLRKYIDKAVANREKQAEYPFIVFDKQSGKYAGSTRFYNYDADRNIIEIGFTWYGKAYQGTGLNKNCKFLLFDFCFRTLGVERVGLGANAKNERSINAMKSVGCTVEGIMRSRGYDAMGGRIDSIFLSILKSEWESGHREQLKGKKLTR